MFGPIFLYFIFSATIAIGAGIHAGIGVALHAAGGSLLALIAGGGLRGTFRGEKAQKIAGSVFALVLLGLAIWVSLGFSVGFFGISISGPIWAALGFVVCFVFADKRLTG